MARVLYLTRYKEGQATAEPPLDRDIEFIYEMGALRFIQRTWRHYLMDTNVQNLAEHTLRVAWIALIIAYHEKAKNIERILKIALVHDISESRTGDVNRIQRVYTERHELEAVTDMLEGTPLSPEFVGYWKEYEYQTSPESKIVKDADIIDLDTEIAEQAAKGFTAMYETTKEMREFAGAHKLNTATGKRLWKQIREANPHDWHSNAKNRLTHGDWKPGK